ncbi:hypothetical protein [Ichthyenterobacterium magnum]|uniref:DUF2490 domain-containing protein n=1 Tax=Ichthyenterobacterium magnum TaxID=1230530 RepID=A0A420DV31_9FLAO|nr:hypothetical protein [Ichthyenterobacterium magnum]RKE98132.1 hypothetical protein BXY80_0206 [Ichthyenterobacterium magnum]
MKIKRVFLVLVLIGQIAYSQDISTPIEGLSTSTNFYYQHSFHKTIGESKFSFFNLSSLKTSYEKASVNNSFLVRNQIFYNIHKNWNLGITGELTNGQKIARFGLQYLLKRKTFITSLYSNIAFSNNSSFVNMLYFEYKPKISNATNFYSRIQIQTTTYFGGDTQYSNLYRFGIEYKQLKLGIGMPWFNPFNAKKRGYKYLGLFIGIIL